MHIPAVAFAVGWQEAQSCAEPECPACRIGRAMAWTTKACQDIDLTLEVLQGVVDLIPRDPVLGPRFQADLAHVSLHELERVAGELAYWGKNLGYACGLAPTEELSTEVGITVHQDDTGEIVAQVVRRQRDPGEEKAN